jgi:hypothetical protein
MHLNKDSSRRIYVKDSTKRRELPPQARMKRHGSGAEAKRGGENRQLLLEAARRNEAYESGLHGFPIAYDTVSRLDFRLQWFYLSVKELSMYLAWC